MHPHDNWRELAALDALGELTAEERQTLQGHLRECADCRAAAAADSAVMQSWLPAGSPATPARDAAPAERERREAFLARARAEGLRFSAEAARTPRPWVVWASAWNTAPVGAAAVLALLVLVTASGWWMWRPAAPTASAAASINATETAIAGARAAELARENERLRRALEASLQQNQAERDQLASVQRQGEETRLRLAQLEQFVSVAEQQAAVSRAELARVKVEAVDASQRLASELQQLDVLRAQLEQVKSAHATDRATLMARQDDIEDLGRQLRLQTASVERARELLAANRDIRDLMGARNLHIVDVHDTNARGKTQKAFGRMFYTEGKSLVFYAYDLEPGRVKNAAFQVWGQRTGNTEQAVSLGILYSDDQKQSRWMMTFDDPKILKEIDSVFVTVEAPGGSKTPSSQRMMYAFLMNEPNHR